MDNLAFNIILYTSKTYTYLFTNLFFSIYSFLAFLHAEPLSLAITEKINKIKNI